MRAAPRFGVHNGDSIGTGRDSDTPARPQERNVERKADSAVTENGKKTESDAKSLTIQGPGGSADPNHPGPTAWREGLPWELMTTVMQELRHMAAAALSHQANGHTLQPTAIVNELWLRMAGGGERQFPSRGDFLAFASHTMRSILVDHARRKLADKRGGGARRTTFLEALERGCITEPDLLELEDELQLMENIHPMSARIIEMRFYGGMSDQQIARRLGVSERTIRRRTRIAQLFMRARLPGEREKTDGRQDNHHG